MLRSMRQRGLQRCPFHFEWRVRRVPLPGSPRVPNAQSARSQGRHVMTILVRRWTRVRLPSALPSCSSSRNDCEERRRVILRRSARRDHELAGNYPAMTDIVKNELFRKLVELISLGLNVACANLNPEARAATLERRSRLEPLAIRSYSSSKPARLCRSMPWPRALPYWRKKPRQLG